MKIRVIINTAFADSFGPAADIVFLSILKWKHFSESA